MNIYTKEIITPLGTMISCATENGICLLEFADRKLLDDELKSISKYFNSALIPGKNVHLQILEQQLQEYFSGIRKEFTVPVIFIGTEFQKKVWKILQQIPYGSTLSYLQQAEMIGFPKAVRAVANANGLNTIAILIPCHRVIGSDGKLTGYSGGIFRKQKLLELENLVIRF